MLYDTFLKLTVANQLVALQDGNVIENDLGELLKMNDKGFIVLSENGVVLESSEAYKSNYAFLQQLEF